MELFLENIAKDAMDPSTYQYFKGLQDRRIVFNDEVDDRIVESAMLPLLEMDNDGSGKPNYDCTEHLWRLAVRRYASL